MGGGKRVYNAAPNTRPPPSNESVVAGGIWAKRLREIPPGCPGSQSSKDAIQNTTVIYSWDAKLGASMVPRAWCS